MSFEPTFQKLRGNPLFFYGPAVRLVERGSTNIHVSTVSRFEYRAVKKYVQSTRKQDQFHITTFNPSIDDTSYPDDMILEGYFVASPYFTIHVMDSGDDIEPFMQTLPKRSVNFMLDCTKVGRQEQQCLRGLNYYLFHTEHKETGRLSLYLSSEDQSRQLVEFRLRL